MGCIIEKLTNLFIGSLPKNMSSTAITTNLFPTNPSRRIPQQKSTAIWNKIIRSQCVTNPSNVKHKPYQLSVLNTSIPIMAIYIGWFHTLHRNSLNTIYIVECVNPCLEFEIWGNRRFKEIIHIIFTISTSYIYVFARFTVDKDDVAEGGGM